LYRNQILSRAGAAKDREMNILSKDHEADADFASHAPMTWANSTCIGNEGALLGQFD
jgi:hypothetical protein